MKRERLPACLRAFILVHLLMAPVHRISVRVHACISLSLSLGVHECVIPVTHTLAYRAQARRLCLTVARFTVTRALVLLPCTVSTSIETLFFESDGFPAGLFGIWSCWDPSNVFLHAT